MVQGAGLRQLTDFVERANLLNRPLRTRTVGGVGPGERNPWLPDVRPAWARSWRCKSSRKLTTASEVKRNCVRVTERGEEA